MSPQSTIRSPRGGKLMVLAGALLLTVRSRGTAQNTEISFKGPGHLPPRVRARN